MGFLLPELTRLQMASGVGYHPLQEVLLTVLCYCAGPQMDSSRRASLIAASLGRDRGMERVLRGEEQASPSSLPKHPLGGAEQPGGAALGLAGRQDADDWSGPLWLWPPLCSPLPQSYSQSKPKSQIGRSGDCDHSQPQRSHHCGLSVPPLPPPHTLGERLQGRF